MNNMLATLLAAEGENGLWLPADINEVIWGSIAFFVLVAIMVKFTKKPIGNYFTNRPKKIEDELNAATQARLEAEAERDRIKSALADSASEAERIRREAEEAAAQLRLDIAARAEADIIAARERGEADLAVTRAQTQSDLGQELARLSIGATEDIVSSSLDDATQQQLIDTYIDQLGAQN